MGGVASLLSEEAPGLDAFSVGGVTPIAGQSRLQQRANDRLRERDLADGP